MQDIQNLAGYLIQLVRDDWVLVVMTMIILPVLKYWWLWLNGKELKKRPQRRQYLACLAIASGLIALVFLGSLKSIKEAAHQVNGSQEAGQLLCKVRHFSTGESEKGTFAFFFSLEIVNGLLRPSETSAKRVNRRWGCVVGGGHETKSG